MKQAMPFAVYCLLGSYLVLNTVNVYSLPIDDGAVSCFSFFPSRLFLFAVTQDVNVLRNESNNSMEKRGRIKRLNQLNNNFRFSLLPTDATSAFSTLANHSFLMLRIFSFLLFFYFTNHRREGRNTLEIFLVDEGLQT